MSLRYLFTASGRPTAVLVEDNLFDLAGNWLGIQDEDGNVWDPEGYFLGVTTNEDRLVRPAQPQGPPFFRSPRPHPSPPKDLSPPPGREPVSLPADFIDALEGLDQPA